MNKPEYILVTFIVLTINDKKCHLWYSDINATNIDAYLSGKGYCMLDVRKAVTISYIYT